MSYRLGRAAEYRVRDDLKSMGYLVVRAAGSKGPFDFVALRRDVTLAVNAKRGGRLDPEEWNIFFDQAQAVGCLPILASTPPRQGPLYFLLTDRKEGGKRQPRTPFDPRERLLPTREVMLNLCPCAYCGTARAALDDATEAHRAAA